MFPPSTYCSLGPYPYFPSSSSSSYPSSFTSFLNPENASSNNNNNNTFLHDPLSIPYTVLPTTTNTTTHHVPNPETITNWTVADHYAAMFKQDLSSGGSGGVHYGSFSNLLTKKPAKKPVKKDRHSKIHTSQGLRDRRVRLSIEIARKFFDLQDMLGFDKASNTLEWLFNKSKKAIEDLTRSKQHSSSAAAHDDHNSFSSSSSEGDDEVYSNDISEERKLKKAQMKESREKARARARERTSGKEKEKEKYQTETDENPQMFHQLMRPDVVVGGGGSGEFQRDDIFNFIEESIVIKRKLKKSSVSHNHQNNLIIPNEASYDNSDCHSSPMSPNWDANNAPNTLTMNLSAGLQIFGKSWEECTSPHRY